AVSGPTLGACSSLSTSPDLLHGLAVQDGGREAPELPANLVRRHGIARVAARALDPLRVMGAVLAEDLHAAGPLARERRRDLLVGDDLDLAHDGAEDRRVQILAREVLHADGA